MRRRCSTTNGHVRIERATVKLALRNILAQIRYMTESYSIHLVPVVTLAKAASYMSNMARSHTNPLYMT